MKRITIAASAYDELLEKRVADLRSLVVMYDASAEVESNKSGVFITVNKGATDQAVTNINIALNNAIAECMIELNEIYTAFEASVTDGSYQAFGGC
jgi:uncharacterized protein (DUF342 family)